MATNPVIHNDGGVYRFADYVSQIPDFLKAEDDVVVLLQLMSDYINNAYRNIDTVEKFEFKFIAIDSNLTAVQNRVTKLINLFKRCEERGEKILYISKPEGNPTNSTHPLYMEYINYAGTIDTLSPAVITIPMSGVVTGDKFYIKFTAEGEDSNSGVYVYNKQLGTLTLDAHGFSQDPFNNSPDEPFKTVIGLAPRIIQFNVSDISRVFAHKVGVYNGLLYYDVYFNARIQNIENITSVHTVSADINGDGELEKLLIDYYNIIDKLPALYDADYDIKFASGCKTLDWEYGYGYGLFYARELTRYDRSSINDNRFIDPLYSPNTTALSITTIKGIGSNKLEITLNSEHRLSKGDLISIADTDLFDGVDYSVEAVLSTKRIHVLTPTNMIGTETEGKVLVRNLYFSKYVDDVTRYQLNMPYSNFIGSTEFSSGDRIIRINPEHVLPTLDFDARVQVIIADDRLYFDRVDGFSINDKIILRVNDSGTLPTGLTEGIIYTISDISDVTVSGSPKKAIKLLDQQLTSFGTSNDVTISLVNRFLYSDDVSVSANTIRVSDVNGLFVGDLVRFSGTSFNLALPTPLLVGSTYRIADVNTVEYTITLDNITITSVPSTGVVFDVIKMIPDPYNIGVVHCNKVLMNSGIITFRSYKGDMIRGGDVCRLNDIHKSHDIATATINSTAIAWSNTVNTIYKKDQLVVYNGILYRVKVTHELDKYYVSTPALDSSRYVVDMGDVIKRQKKLDYNPYMFGMYSVKSLGYDETPDYTKNFSDIASDMYIRKATDLKLKFGHEQREFLFDPRLAPATILERNGFMEVIDSGLQNDAFDCDVTEFIKADTESSKLLHGITDIVAGVLTMSRSGNIVSVTTVANHLFETGINIVITGVAPIEYNGSWQITVTGPRTFTYEIGGTPVAPTIGNATATYTQRIVRDIISIVRSGTVATVTLGSSHGYTNNTQVEISGANEIGYNGLFNITVVDDYSFEYLVSGLEDTPASTISGMTSTYSPMPSDFISVINQYNPVQNGIYVVTENTWVRYDDSAIQVPVTLFTRQNFFDVSVKNPVIASELDSHRIKELQYNGSRIVQVTTIDPHLYTVGTVISLYGAQDPLYNGRFVVDSVLNAVTFTYKIKSGYIPTSPDIGSSYVRSDMWYKYEVSEIEWQKKSSYNTSYLGSVISNINGVDGKITVDTVIPHDFVIGDVITISNTTSFNGTYTINTIESTTRFTFIGGVLGTEISGTVYKGYEIQSNYNKDSLTLLRGEYTFTKSDGIVYKFKAGDIVKISDQYIPYENGIYRVQANAMWKRLDRRLVMKIRNIGVDAYNDVNYTGLDDGEVPYIYRRYSDSEVNNYINDNFNGFNYVYKIENTYAANYSFAFEVVDNIDTTGSLHTQYDARFDYNSIADRSNMSPDFKGVPDMKYPLVEKFERLAYLKDPNVIDIDMIEYLARYMGYDITMLYEDIEESNVYLSDEEREHALRSTIENLPQYYALKSTRSGLEMLLLTFGIVGEVVTMWTRQESPYDELIPDYELRGVQIAETIDGKLSSFVPTPHFMVKVDIEGNFDNQLLPNDNQRIVQQIKRFKPINDVFDGITRYIKVKLSARIGSSPMKATGKLTGSIGYNELDFADVFSNDCI